MTSGSAGPDNVNFCHQIEDCPGPFLGSLWASIFNRVSHWLSTYYGTRSSDSWQLGEGYVPPSRGQPHVTPPSWPDLSLLLLNPNLYLSHNSSYIESKWAHYRHPSNPPATSTALGGRKAPSTRYGLHPSRTPTMMASAISPASSRSSTIFATSASILSGYARPTSHPR